MSLRALIDFYENLDEASLARFGEFYATDAHFKDPFNDVRGVASIRAIFAHMFRQVVRPRFVVGETVADAGGAVLVWRFHFQFRGEGAEQTIRGVSHLKFDEDGLVSFHRDYWDAAEELYMKLPGLGLLMRALKRALAS